MELYTKMLTATRYACSILVLIGMAIFMSGIFVNDNNTLVGVGIGTVMGAVFIFLIGMFLVASEEMVINSRKYKKESA